MDTSMIYLIAGGIAFAIFLIVFIWLTTLRRVVKPNEVHIVRRSKGTDVYGGTGEESRGNSYYEFPVGLPVIGVTVMQLPLDNFDIDLIAYDAYDKDRVPFVVDIKAFFRIFDYKVSAERISSINELNKQLQGIVQGAVRSILAKQKLDTIMEERATYGEQFTTEISEQLKAWGVETVKSIELMDVRDANGQKVIFNIMEKKKSSIEMESRIEVAKNNQAAKEAEILAKQEVDLKEQAAKQVVGQREAEVNKQVGIAKEQSKQAIEEEAKTTKEKEMAVKQVETVRQAEIDKEKTIVDAKAKQEQADIDKKTTVVNQEAEKEAKRLKAEAELIVAEKKAQEVQVTAKAKAEQTKLEGTAEAEIVTAKGKAEADAKTAMETALVQGQIILAQEIGENDGYQEYLIKVRQVEATEAVGVANAKALETAQVKVLAQGGTAGEGMNNVLDLFTSKGGANMAAGIEAFAQSEAGAAIISKLGFMPKTDKKADDFEEVN